MISEHVTLQGTFSTTQKRNRVWGQSALYDWIKDLERKFESMKKGKDARGRSEVKKDDIQ